MKHSPFKVSLFRVWCIYRHRKRTVLLLIADMAKDAFHNIIATNHEKIMIGWNDIVSGIDMQSLTWLKIDYLASLTFYNIIFTVKNQVWFECKLYCSQPVGFMYTNLGYFFFSGIIWPVHQCTLQTSSESMGSTWSRVFWNYNSKNVTIGKFCFYLLLVSYTIANQR